MEISKLVYIIPLIAMISIFYVSLRDPAMLDNFTESNSTVYFIDVGAQDTAGNATLLGPFERVSEPFSKNNITYRLIEEDLVYFNSEIKQKQNFSRVKVELKFIDTIPEGYGLNVGLKNKKEWGNQWKPVYNHFYESLKTLNLIAEDSNFRIYSLSSNFTMPVSSFLNSPPEGSIIATGVPAVINTVPNVTYKNSNSSVSELRGDHTFYIYNKGNLNLSTKKQDLNWYNGSDALEIKLYSGNKLVKNVTIPDDGNTRNNGITGTLQNGTLESSLEEGVYKVTMTGGSDFLIRNIELNSGNIVVKNPFLAGILYTNATMFNLYTRAVRGDRIDLRTQHVEGFQTINISSGSYTKSLNITAINEHYYIELPPSNELYRIEVPRGDITINANGYFSTSDNSYFNPSAVKIFPLQNSMDWLNKSNVDYVIVSSNQVVKDGDWTTGSAEYDLSNAYIENDELNFVISAPHLKYYNYSIPVDWIKIYMEK